MKKIPAIFTLLITVNFLYAQLPVPNTPCAAAAEGTAGNVTISYTIGEMTLVESRQKENLFVTQGVLQPVLVGKDGNPNGFNDGEIKVYPNPTPNLLSIEISLLSSGKFLLQLYDATGKLLINDNIAYSGFTTRQYQLARYAGAAYLLRVQFEPASGTVKYGTYKIIKTN